MYKDITLVNFLTELVELLKIKPISNNEVLLKTKELKTTDNDEVYIYLTVGRLREELKLNIGYDYEESKFTIGNNKYNYFEFYKEIIKRGILK